MSSKADRSEKTEAVRRLRKLCPPGTKVYTILRHRSRSGMSRSISPVVIVDGEPVDLAYLVARLGIGSFDRRHDGVKMGGCGMDMGFSLVSHLSYALHGSEDKGVKAIAAGKQGRPITPSRRRYRAGYSLIHRWL